MFTFGWFSSGRDQAAMDLFTVAPDPYGTGLHPNNTGLCFLRPGSRGDPGVGSLSPETLENRNLISLLKNMARNWML